MEDHSYLFVVNYISFLLLAFSVLTLIIFIGIKIIALSTESKSFLANNSLKFIFASLSLAILSLCGKYYSKHLFIENSLRLLLDNNILVKIDGEIAKRDFSHYFRKSIAKIIKFKDKGSSPRAGTYVELYLKDEQMVIYLLRQDSRDFDMYWISALSQTYNIDLGYIKLDPKILEGGVLSN